MKNLKKKIIATLTSALIVSSMMVSASAVSTSRGIAYTESDIQYIVNSQLANYLSGGLNENVLSAGSTTNYNADLNTANVEAALPKSTDNAVQSYNGPAKQNSTCGKNNTTNTCPNKTAAACDTTGKNKCQQNTTCSTTAKCVTSSCDSAGKQSGTCSKTSKTAENRTINTWVNGISSRCGINLKNSSVTPAVQTPKTSGGTSSIPANDNNNTVPKDNGSADNNSFEQQVVSLVNQQRAANGLAPLTLNSQLSTAARAKSQDMHDKNYFSHTSPTYGSPFDMLHNFGISYKTAGENIAMGYATPEAVMNGWMNSPGHKANILNPSYTQIGVGFVADGNYWTQEFIG